MPKPGQQMTPGRKKLVHTVTKYIRDRYPRVLENDDIAEALGLTREQVRNCVRNYMNREDTHDILEDGPYRYVAVSPNETHVAPVSGGPVLNGSVDLRTRGDGPTPTFRYLTTLGDGSVLLQDDAKDVWQATRL
jgi:hypothetical protein